MQQINAGKKTLNCRLRRVDAPQKLVRAALRTAPRELAIQLQAGAADSLCSLDNMAGKYLPPCPLLNGLVWHQDTKAQMWGTLIGVLSGLGRIPGKMHHSDSQAAKRCAYFIFTSLFRICCFPPGVQSLCNLSQHKCHSETCFPLTLV